jgi:hypothetical protein
MLYLTAGLMVGIGLGFGWQGRGLSHLHPPMSDKDFG